MDEIARKFFPDEDWKMFDNGKKAVSQTSKFTIREVGDGEFIATLKIPTSIYADHFYDVVIKDASLEVVCQRLLDWSQRRVISYDNWIDEARSLYGDNHLEWRFKCPKCGESQSIKECFDKGMTGTQPMQLCLSCGHFNPILNPVVIESSMRNHIERTYVFEFDKEIKF